MDALSGEKEPMSWDLRLSVSLKIASVLKCIEKEEDLPLYLDLNPYRVLFDKVFFHPIFLFVPQMSGS